MSPKRRRAHAPSHEPAQAPELSAAERMAAFKKAMKVERSQRFAYSEGLDFSLDDFQIQAMDALEAGRSVLVAAPTGAGKTVVGEFATHLARTRGRRCFYTTPIKALSNQKFLDLRARYGEDEVGLLTGDTSINPGAPILVMTTEVLRNMIYAGSDLSDLESVVLDEVHYLADRFRGPVWEEVIIHLPADKTIIALSATVSNAEEFGSWIAQVRGGCEVVVSEVRPVPLYQHMIVGRTLYDLYEPGRKGSVEGRLNPELLAAVSPHALQRGGRGARNWQARGPARPESESRPSTLIALERAGLLPTITFVFSRVGCEAAVEQVMRAGIVLTSAEEARLIRQAIEEVTQLIAPEDFAVLGIAHWASALERGVAAHHAGMLPLLKETVEKLFACGLIKMVYATETLALGINMPARSVVIESLTKWNGAEHVRLTPGEYTQLSGRAGRRGIDSEGHSVVLHRGTVAPEELASLASKRTYPLISAFKPNYNMVVNLLDHSTRKSTRDVLETSFAQFQADGQVVELATRAKHLRGERDSIGQSLVCEKGDAQEYFRLRDELVLAQKAASKKRNQTQRSADSQLLSGLVPGDVISYGKGRRKLYAVIAFQEKTAIGRVATTVVGMDGRFHTLAHGDASTGAQHLAHLRISGGSALRRNKERMRIAEELRQLVRSGNFKALSSQTLPFDSAEVERLEASLRAHPVHQCPKREEHARAGHQWARIDRELRKLEESIDRRTNSVAKHFDRVCDVLEDLGFLRGDEVSERGQKLRMIFGERDLIVMEAISQGCWDDVTAQELAAIVSTCVYESRSEEASLVPPGLPTSLLKAWGKTLQAVDRVHAAEKAHGVEASPQPDPGLLAPCLAWAHGASLSTALADDEMQGGDFVRWIRQVIDLLDQIRGLEDPVLSAKTKQARDLLVHGVVAWSAL